jgi:hypothetical protein
MTKDEVSGNGPMTAVHLVLQGKGGVRKSSANLTKPACDDPSLVEAPSNALTARRGESWAAGPDGPSLQNGAHNTPKYATSRHGSDSR